MSIFDLIYDEGGDKYMANLSDVGLGSFIESILTGLGNGLISLAPGLAVFIIVGAVGAGLVVMFRNIFKKVGK